MRSVIRPTRRFFSPARHFSRPGRNAPRRPSRGRAYHPFGRRRRAERDERCVTDRTRRALVAQRFNECRRCAGSPARSQAVPVRPGRSTARSCWGEPPPVPLARPARRARAPRAPPSPRRTVTPGPRSDLAATVHRPGATARRARERPPASSPSARRAVAERFGARGRAPTQPGQLHHLGGVGHAHRGPLAQQPVAARRRHRRHRPGHGPDRSQQPRCVVRGAQRPGAPGGLDDDRGRRRAAMSRLRCRKRLWSAALPGGTSATSAPPLRDRRLEQPRVARRVRPVDAAGEHHDRPAAARERAAVRGGVDPVGAARDDARLARRPARREVDGDALAVGGRRARAHERDRAAEQTAARSASPRTHSPNGAPSPRSSRPRRPARVARARRTSRRARRALPGRRPGVDVRVATRTRAQPLRRRAASAGRRSRHAAPASAVRSSASCRRRRLPRHRRLASTPRASPTPRRRRPSAQRVGRTERRDERARDQVARLRERAPRGASGPVVDARRRAARTEVERDRQHRTARSRSPGGPIASRAAPSCAVPPRPQQQRAPDVARPVPRALRGPRGSTRRAAPGRRRAGSACRGRPRGRGRPSSAGRHRAARAASRRAPPRPCATACPRAARRAAARRRPTRGRDDGRRLPLGAARHARGCSSTCRSTRSSSGPESLPKYRRRCSLRHVQSSPLPTAWPHGHGLAASTSWNRAGYRAAPCGAVQHELAVLERLAQRLRARRSRTPAPRRGTARRGAPATPRRAAACPSRRRRRWRASRCGAGPRTAAAAAARRPGRTCPPRSAPRSPRRRRPRRGRAAGPAAARRASSCPCPAARPSAGGARPPPRPRGTRAPRS